MKIGISSTQKDLQSQIDPRFGRCAYFIVVQTDDMSFDAFNNESGSLGSGAGIQAARFLIEKGVATVITGACGPNATDVFNQGNIKLITGQTGSVNDVIQNFKSGKLIINTNTDGNSNKASSNDPQSAQGRCMGGGGRCQGGGGGRGMGGGGGRGMGGGGGRGMGGGGGRGMGGGGGMGGGQGK